MAAASIYVGRTDPSAFDVIPANAPPCRPTSRAVVSKQWCDEHCTVDGLQKLYPCGDGHENSTLLKLCSAQCQCSTRSADLFIPLGYAAFMSSALAYGLISFANKHLDSSDVTSFWPLQVPVAVFLLYFFGKKRTELSAGQVIGGSLITCALFLIVFSDKQKLKQKEDTEVKRLLE